MKTIRQITGNIPAVRIAREAREGAENAAAELAESRRLAEQDPKVTDYLSDLLDAVIAMHEVAVKTLDAIERQAQP